MTILETSHTETSHREAAVSLKKANQAMHRRRRFALTGLLSGPVLWLLVAYIGSLVLMLVTSLYKIDSFTTDIVRSVSADNFRELTRVPVYRNVVLRTMGVAASVTIIDLVLAFPIAFFLAKVARARMRRILAVAVTIPLWASYLVKAYALRTFLDPAGGLVKKLFGVSPGFGLTSVVIVLAYLWLPYAILPIYAGLDRLPDSLLEASSDLGGKAGVTLRAVVLPMLFPSMIAASIFTFSLSMGDYIAVDIVGGKTQMLGTVIYDSFGSNNVPFAAAFSFVPMVIMVVYLLFVRRSGALDNL